MVPKQNNFDALRIAAAFCVLVSHQHALAGFPEPGIAGVGSLGGIGVLVFFSISGFLVAQSWVQDPNVLRFAGRRALRIWPALAVVVLLSALVLGPFRSSLTPNEYLRDPGVWKYLRNLRFLLVEGLPGVRFNGSAIPAAINGSMWSIPLEVKCYLALAFLGATTGRWLRPVVFVSTFALAAGFLVFDTRGQVLATNLGLNEQTRLLLELGLFFAAGVLLQFWEVHRLSGPTQGVLLAGAACVAAVAWSATHGLLAAWLLVPLTAVLTGTGSAPGLRQTGRWGDFSYGVYLYAFPVQQVLIDSLGQQLPWMALLALTVAATLLCAVASWHFVEKPALRLKPRSTHPIADKVATQISAPGLTR